MDTSLTLPDDLRARVSEAIASAVGNRWASRIWLKDASLWTSDERVAASVAQRLGWLDAPWRFRNEVAELGAFGEQIEGEGRTDALVCGVGASTLVAEVLSLAYPGSDKGLRVHALDSTDPEAVTAIDRLLDPERTLRVIAAKSGPATETLAFLEHLYEAEERRVGRIPHSKAGNAFVSISNPGQALEDIPRSEYFRETFLDPPDVGSRYSALTYAGLVPASLLRLDIDPLLEDARIMAEACRADGDENPGLVLGAAIAALARAGRDKLTFVIEPDLASLGAWLEQLVAGSLGRAGAGIVPVDGEPLGRPEQYGPDRVFLRLGPESDTDWHREVDAALAALTEAGHPLIDIRLDDASWVGAEFFRWEFATAVAGIGLGVDPFDEPTVDPSGGSAAEYLETYTHQGRLPEVSPVATRHMLRAFEPAGSAARSPGEGDLTAILREHITRAPQRGYFHLGAFLAPSDDRTASLRALQARLRDGTGRASTMGYGPRFLHATGGLHKDGPPIGCFIQLTSQPAADVPIPGRPESFGTLIAAQAMGDIADLASRDLPVLRIDLGSDVEAGLGALRAALEQALA